MGFFTPGRIFFLLQIGFWDINRGLEKVPISGRPQRKKVVRTSVVPRVGGMLFLGVIRLGSFCSGWDYLARVTRLFLCGVCDGFVRFSFCCA